LIKKVNYYLHYELEDKSTLDSSLCLINLKSMFLYEYKQSSFLSKKDMSFDIIQIESFNFSDNYLKIMINKSIIYFSYEKLYPLKLKQFFRLKKDKIEDFNKLDEYFIKHNLEELII
jgi:hypothetical protein